MYDGEITGAIFLNLAKAFDTVNHGSNRSYLVGPKSL